MRVEGDGDPGVIGMHPDHIEHHRPEADPVTFVNGPLIDSSTIDERAVLAVEISDCEGTLCHRESGLSSGHTCHLEQDITLLGRTEEVRALAEVVGQPGSFRLTGQTEAVGLIRNVLVKCHIRGRPPTCLIARTTPIETTTTPDRIHHPRAARRR